VWQEVHSKENFIFLLFVNIIAVYCAVRCTDVCSLAPAAGDCEDYHSAWYYDQSTDRCLKFVYGGCGGNGNRFDSQEACQRRCRINKAAVNGLGENLSVTI